MDIIYLLIFTIVILIVISTLKMVRKQVSTLKDIRDEYKVEYDDMIEMRKEGLKVEKEILSELKEIRKKIRIKRLNYTIGTF
ncbi:hypothetical protein [Virgibacillus ndiopensis]|uniref:hypothetical protein n=1 Tax=Virgibacillus ndiopensis TaxID=2004408 RepID=UPI000C085B0D|nr:hypothetical protein [Virgibacillus ndiopensis]